MQETLAYTPSALSIYRPPTKLWENNVSLVSVCSQESPLPLPHAALTLQGSP